MIVIIGGALLARMALNASGQGEVATTTENGAQVPVSSAAVGKPAFEWLYESFETEGIPQTKISIAATYPDGAVVTKYVDDIEGSCNEYAERDSDAYDQASMIICYYAGLGHYFKVVESDGSYLVQRKVFEEASPEYDPPVQAYETVATF